MVPVLLARAETTGYLTRYHFPRDGCYVRSPQGFQSGPNIVSLVRELYLAIVRPALSYAAKVWSPQTIDLIRRMERVQRCALKFILDLPFLCEESYRDRLQSIDILPICYWHEFLDLVFFFKATNGIVCESHDALPERIVLTRVTRASAGNAKSFRPKKCRTSTYQHSFLVRTSRIWNVLPLQLRYERVTLNQFKSLLSSYYKDALNSRYDIEYPRTWKSVCLKCNVKCNAKQPLRAYLVLLLAYYILFFYSSV